MLGGVVKGEQRFHLALQHVIAAARLVHKRGALRHGSQQRCVINP
jgi:hypothetical protein